MLDRYALTLSNLLNALTVYADLWEREHPRAGGVGLMTGNIFAQSSSPESPKGIDDYLVNGVQKTLENVKEQAQSMGWEGMIPEISRAYAATKHTYSREQVPGALRHLGTRIRDELATTYLLHVRAADVALYSAEDPFGAVVAKKFPKATEDISEAGKCLALRQYTSVVFHLMRAMEVMVQRLAKRLGVTNVDKVWGVLLSDIHAAIGKMPKTDAKRARYSEAHALLYHVKQAWRNDTMHPKQTYTEAEARAIYAAVKLFAENLAKLA